MTSVWDDSSVQLLEDEVEVVLGCIAGSSILHVPDLIPGYSPSYSWPDVIHQHLLVVLPNHVAIHQEGPSTLPLTKPTQHMVFMDPCSLHSINSWGLAALVEVNQAINSLVALKHQWHYSLWYKKEEKKLPLVLFENSKKGLSKVMIFFL